jgi:hypothetical protein
VLLPQLEVDPVGKVLPVDPHPSAPIADVRSPEPDPLHQKVLGDTQLRREGPGLVHDGEEAYRMDYDGLRDSRTLSHGAGPKAKAIVAMRGGVHLRP